MVSRVDNEAGTSQVLLPVLLSAFAIPVSVLLWIVKVVHSILTPEAEHLSEDHPVISSWRWLAAVAIPMLFILYGLRRPSLDLSGAILDMPEGSANENVGASVDRKIFIDKQILELSMIRMTWN